MTLFYLLVVLSFLIWLYKFLTPSYRLKRIGDKIPGPRPWPLVGNSFLFLKKDNREYKNFCFSCFVSQNLKALIANYLFSDFLRTIIDICKMYGPVSRVWLGKQLFIILTDAKDIEVSRFCFSIGEVNWIPQYRNTVRTSRVEVQLCRQCWIRYPKNIYSREPLKAKNHTRAQERINFWKNVTISSSRLFS